MNAVRANELITDSGTKRVVKLLVWLSLSTALSLVFFREFWLSLPAMLSPDWIFGEYHASSWGILALCLFFLWLKRKEIWREMSADSYRVERTEAYPRVIGRLTTPLIGLALISGALLMPSLQDYLIFQVLLATLGIFIVIFGMAAQIPSIMLAIYGFAISFPLAVKSFAETAYSQASLVPLTGLLNTLGYPLENQGQWLHLTTFTGEPIKVLVTAACAGPATMGVFLAIFSLMALDRPLTAKKMTLLFLFGVLGTWLQSFIRLFILLLAGFHLGESALWTTHYWTIYLLFPLWYLFFAYIYFHQKGQQQPIAKARL